MELAEWRVECQMIERGERKNSEDERKGRKRGEGDEDELSLSFCLFSRLSVCLSARLASHHRRLYSCSFRNCDVDGANVASHSAHSSLSEDDLKLKKTKEQFI